MRSRNFLVFLLIIVVISFAITNSSAVNTIDDSAYVVALGFDTGSEGNILLSFQIAIPSSDSSSGSSSGSSSQSSSSIVNTVECDTVYSGLNLVNSYLSKKINLSYCKVLVFSEEFASKGISEYVSTFMNDIEVRPSCHILISRCEAKYFLENSKPLLENLSSKYYEMQLSSEKNTGYTKSVTLLDFYNSYFDTFKQPYAILGSIKDANSDAPESGTSLNQSEEKLKEIVDVGEGSSKDQKNIENLGLAIFKNDNFVGELSTSQTVYHLILTNEFKSTIINIPSPFSDSDYISLSITSAKSKNNVDIINGSPYITCDVCFNVRVLSSTIASNYLNNENLQVIEDYANSFFKAHLEDYLYQTSQDFQADIVGFGKEAVKKFTTISDWKNYDWLNNYKNSFFNVNVKTNVSSSYLIIGNNR